MVYFMLMSEQKEKFFKFCPGCGSSNWKLTDIPALIAYRELYVRCVDCGFQAKEFPEGTSKFIEDFRRQKNKASDLR